MSHHSSANATQDMKDSPEAAGSTTKVAHAELPSSKDASPTSSQHIRDQVCCVLVSDLASMTPRAIDPATPHPTFVAYASSSSKGAYRVSCGGNMEAARSVLQAARIHLLEDRYGLPHVPRHRGGLDHAELHRVWIRLSDQGDGAYARLFGLPLQL